MAYKEKIYIHVIEKLAGHLKYQVYKLYFLDCGEVKKQKRKKKEEIRDIMLNDKTEWVISRNVKPVKSFLSKKSYQSCVFYTGTPGYRLQLHVSIDRREREIFFCIKVLKVAYNEDLEWPCRQGISIKSSENVEPIGIEYWFIPEKDVLERPNSEKDKIHTRWIGPFNLSHHLIIEFLTFDIYLG